MASRKEKQNLGKERLQRIIDLCRSVEEKGLDPFMVDVDDIIAAVREYFPEWELPEEFSLDAEAIDRLASVIKLQSDWVKHRSTSLYTDPFLIEEKIQKLSKRDIANLFLRVWHPIVELEQIFPQGLAEAIKYWQSLVPLDERWLQTEAEKTETGVVTSEELIKQRIFAEKAFGDELQALWEELKQRVGVEGKIRYWDFIGAETYPETVRRAYFTSFLVTYGYATLEIHPLEEETYIRPFEKPEPLTRKKQTISVPISIGVEDWTRWKEGKS